MLRCRLRHSTETQGRRLPVEGRCRESGGAWRYHDLTFGIANLKHDAWSRVVKALLPLCYVDPVTHGAILHAVLPMCLAQLRRKCASCAVLKWLWSSAVGTLCSPSCRWEIEA